MGSYSCKSMVGVLLAVHSPFYWLFSSCYQQPFLLDFLAPFYGWARIAASHLNSWLRVERLVWLFWYYFRLLVILLHPFGGLAVSFRNVFWMVALSFLAFEFYPAAGSYFWLIMSWKLNGGPKAVLVIAFYIGIPTTLPSLLQWLVVYLISLV